MSAEDVPSPPIDSGVDNIADKLGGLNTGDAIDRPQTDEEYGLAQLTLRAIVTSKEAGVIIGKAGQNVADLRDKTGVRAGVSKVVPGVHDRVLTVTGALNGIAEAYGLVADGLVKGAPQMGMGGVISSPNTHRKFDTRRNACFLLQYTQLILVQRFASSSLTTRWAPSSVVKA